MSLSFILFSMGLCFIMVVINPHYSRLGYLLQLIGVARSFSYSLELSACFLGKYLWTSLSDYMIMSEFLNKWNRFKEDEDPLGIDKMVLSSKSVVLLCCFCIQIAPLTILDVFF